MKRPKVVSTELKRRAVERVAAGEAASAVAADLKIKRQRLYEWQEQVRQGGLEALRGPGRPRKGALDGPPLRSAILNEGAAARCSFPVSSPAKAVIQVAVRSRTGRGLISAQPNSD